MLAGGERVDDDLYAWLVDELGEAGVFELAVLVGYYTTLAVVMDVFEVSVPRGRADAVLRPLPNEGSQVGGRDRQPADRTRRARARRRRRWRWPRRLRDAAFAGALDAERVERARRILGHQHLDRRHLRRGRHQVVGEGRGERLAALVVDELLEQRAADPLRDAAAIWPSTSIGLTARPTS